MDYSATITVPLAPNDAARRIYDDLERWWSTRVDRHPGGFTVRFNASHVTFAIDPAGTDDAFNWTCTAAHMIIEDVHDASEWAGTRVRWQVDPEGTGSRITLTHEGLNDQIDCYDVCTRGWQHFFETSLRDHLSGGKAAPERS